MKFSSREQVLLVQLDNNNFFNVLLSSIKCTLYDINHFIHYIKYKNGCLTLLIKWKRKKQPFYFWRCNEDSFQWYGLIGHPLSITEQYMLPGRDSDLELLLECRLSRGWIRSYPIKWFPFTNIGHFLQDRWPGILAYRSANWS